MYSYRDIFNIVVREGRNMEPEYRRTNISQTDSFAGLRVNLYDNRNGKYGSVTFGKGYDFFNLSEADRELANQLFLASVNLFRLNDLEYSQYWYKVDIKEE